jgi:hypothetical protein
VIVKLGLGHPPHFAAISSTISSNELQQKLQGGYEGEQESILVEMNPHELALFIKSLKNARKVIIKYYARILCFAQFLISANILIDRCFKSSKIGSFVCRGSPLHKL